jgi:hypothetical protein
VADTPEVQARRDRYEGRAPNGTVGLYAYDEGVYLTLRCFDKDDEYYLDPALVGIDAPPGKPGIPVTFFVPEDAHAMARYPLILITRDSIDVAMQRWHPGSLQYRAPASTAVKVSVDGQEGFDRVEYRQQACPFDISYSLMLYCRTRLDGNKMLDYVLRRFPPYCNLRVRDSLGDNRLYTAFMESVGMLDSENEVGDRLIAFALSLRVEAELDLGDPEVQKVVTQAPILTTKVK